MINIQKISLPKNISNPNESLIDEIVFKFVKTQEEKHGNKITLLEDQNKKYLDYLKLFLNEIINIIKIIETNNNLEGKSYGEVEEFIKIIHLENRLNDVVNTAKSKIFSQSRFLDNIRHNNETWLNIDTTKKILLKIFFFNDLCFDFHERSRYKKLFRLRTRFLYRPKIKNIEIMDCGFWPTDYDEFECIFSNEGHPKRTGVHIHHHWEVLKDLKMGEETETL